jgi:hypothetical protein
VDKPCTTATSEIAPAHARREARCERCSQGGSKKRPFRKNLIDTGRERKVTVMTRNAEVL